MKLKRLAQHLGATVSLYFISVAVSYGFFWWTMVAALTPLASGEKLGLYGTLFLFAGLVFFALLFGWAFVFLRVFRELYGVLFPEELRQGPPLSIRGMRPGQAVGALRAISALDPFRRVFPQGAVLASLLPLGELLFLFYLPALAIPLFPLFFALPLSLFVVWMPSGISKFVPPSQRLLSILSIAHFLRSRRADLTAQYARSAFLFDVRHIMRMDERFVIRKASTYLNDFLAEVAPAARAELGKFWAALYVGMSLKAVDDAEFQKAADTIETMRQILERPGDDRARVSRLMDTLTSVKSSLPDSWKVVEEKGITVETERPLSPQELQVTILSVISVALAFVFGLASLLFK